MAGAEFDRAPFAGFGPGAFGFLQGIADHQDKAWFTANRQAYDEEVCAPLASLVVDVAARLAKTGTPLCGDPRRAMFRLNRDVRFSTDKSPYKTHAGAAMTRDGDKHAPGLLYIHIDPKGCFAAAGFFRPAPPVLGQLREGLVARATAWGNVERALTKRGLALDRDSSLVKLPRGFDAVPDAVEAVLRLKSWIVRRELSAAQVAQATLADDVAAFATAAAPLLRFGWEALAA